MHFLYVNTESASSWFVYRIRTVSVIIKSYYRALCSLLPIVCAALTVKHYTVALHNTSHVYTHKHVTCCEGRAVGLKLPEVGINLLKTKCNLLYRRNQSVPRSKHFPPRL